MPVSIGRAVGLPSEREERLANGMGRVLVPSTPEQRDERDQEVPVASDEDESFGGTQETLVEGGGRSRQQNRRLVSVCLVAGELISERERRVWRAEHCRRARRSRCRRQTARTMTRWKIELERADRRLRASIARRSGRQWDRCRGRRGPLLSSSLTKMSRGTSRTEKCARRVLRRATSSKEDGARETTRRTWMPIWVSSMRLHVETLSRPTASVHGGDPRALRRGAELRGGRGGRRWARCSRR